MLLKLMCHILNVPKLRAHIGDYRDEQWKEVEVGGVNKLEELVDLANKVLFL